jgi:LysR family transcriptional regulator, glycine cleavage system transcriptional activator
MFGAAPTNEKIALHECARRMYAASVATRPAPKRAARPRAYRPIQLAALRGFDAAAQLLSFTLAAERLALSQSAISRQIATLERQVGRALFVRKVRSLALTADGARLHAAVARALTGVDACVDAIRGIGQAPRVGLATYASFASLWLVPRLASFQQAAPQIEIRIDASDRLVDLVVDGLDVAIRRSLPSRIDASQHATLLCEEFVTPAMSPHLLERTPALREPADLQGLPLIDQDWQPSIADGWLRWFDTFGVALRPGAGPKMIFSFVDQAMQAAVRGQGVVMAGTPMLDDALAAGQLVTPFPALRMATGFNFYLLVNPQRADAPEVASFVSWLVDEFARGPRRQT